MMNGKPRNMDYKFAIKVLSNTKVETQSMRGNPKAYGYQNQYFYDIARHMAIQALKEKHENNKPKTSETTVNVAEIKQLTIDELKSLPLREWVWIEVLEPLDYEEKVSAYYRKHEDYTHDSAFCCGYPGLSFSFYYEYYGKTWAAYKHQPEERKDESN